MEVIQAIDEMTAWAGENIRAGRDIGLVPTMGYFHEGHLRLMRRAAESADLVVVSVFVNPIQFGAGEDFERYPVDHRRDRELAAREGVDLLFMPSAAEMYEEGFQTRIQVGALSGTLCGLQRQGHFDGVATVVGKLFHIVRPRLAVFGEKDFQQLAIIRRMVTDLNWAVEIIGHPVVREKDGLAMSSRNTYLSSDQRQSALCLFHSLDLAGRLIREGLRDAGKLRRRVRDCILSFPGVNIDYVSIVDQRTLHDQQTVDEHSRLLLAVRIGATRLIDNAALGEE